MLTELETKPACNRSHVPLIFAVGGKLVEGACDQHEVWPTRVSEMTEKEFSDHRGPIVPKPKVLEKDCCRDLMAAHAQGLRALTQKPQRRAQSTREKTRERGTKRQRENQRRTTPARKSYEEDIPNGADANLSNSPPTPCRQSPRTDLRRVTVEAHALISEVGVKKYAGACPVPGLLPVRFGGRSSANSRDGRPAGGTGSSLPQWRWHVVMPCPTFSCGGTLAFARSLSLARVA